MSSKYYEPYAYFARTLRSWMIAYGIGVPILVASQDELSKKILDTGDAKIIVATFLVGVLFQIFTALIYKYSLWLLHLGELDKTYKIKRTYKLSHWFFIKLWPTICFDITSIFLFVWPTYTVLSASTIPTTTLK